MKASSPVSWEGKRISVQVSSPLPDWVSDAYARSGATNEFDAWRTWVRRSEALYALVSAHVQGEPGVGGVDWANNRLRLGEEVVDFAEAASSDTNVERYLRQSLGVFGGAYYSQMAEMGLFRQGDHGIQRATNSAGRAAADAFRTSIGGDVERLLLASIRSARVTREDLEALSTIAPSRIPQASLERQNYERLLFGAEEATKGDRSRSATLKLILHAAEALGERPDADAIRWHLFSTETFGDQDLDGQRVRWEAYHSHDLLQVAAASFLEWAIDLMGEFDAGRTLGELEVEIQARLGEAEPEGSVESWSTLRDGIDPEAFDYRGTSSRLVSRRGRAEDKCWDAVRLMAALDRRLMKRAALRDCTRRELGVQGNGRSIVTELAWFAHHAQAPVADVVARYVVERVVRRHSWVAMQKLRRQRDYTFLFEAHDGRLTRRNGYAPVPTTPRLNPAVQFLVDLGLVDQQGTTPAGRIALGATT